LASAKARSKLHIHGILDRLGVGSRAILARIDTAMLFQFDKLSYLEPVLGHVP
jgi:hypothetical protein